MLQHDDFESDGTGPFDGQEKLAVSDLVRRYRSIGKRSARAILDRGILLWEAETLWEEAALDDFYKEVNLPRKGSTVTKYKAIGAKASMLEAYIELLPDNWTTIYELACLERDQFDRLVQDKILHPDVTMQAIQDHFAKSGNSAKWHVGASSAPKSQMLAFDLNLVASARRSAFANKLKRLFDEFEVNVSDKVVATLEAFIEQGEDDA